MILVAADMGAGPADGNASSRANPTKLRKLRIAITPFQLRPTNMKAAAPATQAPAPR